MSTDSRTKQQFQQVVDAFAGDDPIGSGELYSAAAYFTEIAAHGVAMSLLRAAAELHDTEWITGEQTYTEVFLETFRRAIYDNECAERYGYAEIARSPAIVEVVTSFLLQRAAYEVAQIETEIRNSMANVAIFPAPTAEQ